MNNILIQTVFLCVVVFIFISDLTAQVVEGQSSVRFSKKLLCVDPNEGCDVGDINNDGRLDIIAGGFMYLAPDFVPRPVRNLEKRDNGFVHNNSEHLYDVDGDGLLDVIVGTARRSEISWHKNPGGEALMLGQQWDRFPLATSNETNELFLLRDLDGDSVPEILVASWVKKDPLRIWRLTKNEQGDPTGKMFILGEEGGGHGLGFGDIDGDGLDDIATEIGWYKRPQGDIFAASWQFHDDLVLPHPSVPFVLADVDGDSKVDVLFGLAHGYGVFWRKQLAPKEDGTRQWEECLIDDSWEGAHVALWDDLDNDGAAELIIGKRWRSHAGRDKGDSDPAVIFYYKWSERYQRFERHTIAGEKDNIGVGLLFRVVDINGDGRKDIVTAGKTGTYLLLNQGPTHDTTVFQGNAVAKNTGFQASFRRTKSRGGQNPNRFRFGKRSGLL